MENRLGFGVFLAPHHPIGENPTLQLQRDLQLADAARRILATTNSGSASIIREDGKRLRRRKCFSSAAAMVTHRIKLGTGVVSIPYHHPFTVAQRIVMLDHLSRGRAMLGVGPGALPSDAFMLGIDPMTQRDQMDEGLGVIIRLLPSASRSPSMVHGIGCAMRRCICVRCSVSFAWRSHR